MPLGLTGILTIFQIKEGKTATASKWDAILQQPAALRGTSSHPGAHRGCPGWDHRANVSRLNSLHCSHGRTARQQCHCASITQNLTGVRMNWLVTVDLSVSTGDPLIGNDQSFMMCPLISSDNWMTGLLSYNYFLGADTVSSLLYNPGLALCRQTWINFQHKEWQEINERYWQ